MNSLLRRQNPAHGMASLSVVMVLFFILAMVAAYTNRSLIFEQRTSANSYRSARALAAADAGVDWTITMLNGGAIDALCTQSSAPADNDFKTRYLNLQPDGSFAPITWTPPPSFPTGGLTGVQAQPACSATDTNGWKCTCPKQAPLQQQLDNANVTGPVFAVSFKPTGQGPGSLALQVRGCHNVRSGTVSDVNTFGSCHVNDITSTSASVKAALAVDGAAIVSTSVGLVPALPVPPTAAMTVRRNITQSTGILSVANPDAATGVALRAGGSVTAPPGGMKVGGVAGSALNPLSDADPDLSGIPPEQFFRIALGLPVAQYQQQPAAVRCAAGCTDLVDVAKKNPTRVIFVEGNLDLGSASLGTPSTPTMLVVTGDLAVSGTSSFKGVVFVGGNLTWSGSGGTVVGAIIVGGDYVGSGDANITYDREIIRRINRGYGSFVRIPGTWHTEN